MKYIATALNDVKIWASMPTKQIKHIGSDIVEVQSSKWQWVEIKRGDSAEVGLVTGIHPSCLPGVTPTSVSGAKVVLLDGYSHDDLPKESFDLLRLETAPE